MVSQVGIARGVRALIPYVFICSTVLIGTAIVMEDRNVAVPDAVLSVLMISGLSAYLFGAMAAVVASRFLEDKNLENKNLESKGFENKGFESQESKKIKKDQENQNFTRVV